MSKPLPPVMAAKCATCPFREGSKMAGLAPYLAARSATEGRLCHSAGGNSAVIPKAKNYHKKGHICRGSRDLQLLMMHAAGVIEEPTDKAWRSPALA